MGGRRPSLPVLLTWHPWPSTRELCFSFTHDPATCILPTLIKSSVFYTITIPVLNPLIYSLRNKDVKDTAKRVLKPKINPSWDIRFQDSFKSLITKSSCVYAQSCPTLCDPMDYSPPGAFVLRIIQTRILEWVAISSSRESSSPRDGTCSSYVSCTGWQVLYH